MWAFSIQFTHFYLRTVFPASFVFVVYILLSVTFDQGIFMATMIKFFEEKSEEAYEIIAMNETCQWERSMFTRAEHQDIFCPFRQSSYEY